MKTIFDYLRQYRDVGIEEKKWGQFDILLMAILAYAPVRGFTEERSFSEFIEEILSYKQQKGDDLMTPKVKEVAEILKGARRYEEMVIEDFDDVFNDETQFGAICGRIGKIKTIGFRGTNNSVVGWVENFRLAYQYPTITHILAIEYVKEHIKRRDRTVYLTGHSKGGNLALVAGMEAGWLRKKKIRRIWNFDGPGLLRAQFLSRKFRRVRAKVTNVLPEQSVVGTLLYSTKSRKIVKSNEKGVFAHYPTSWLLDRDLEQFVEGEQSPASQKLHQNTIQGLASVERGQVELVFETIFASLETKMKQKGRIEPKDIMIIVKSIAGMDKKTRKYLLNILGCLVKFR